METSPTGPVLPLNDLETSTNNDLVQRALNSGMSMVYAYVSHSGAKLFRETNDHREITPAQQSRVYRGPRIAFLDWKQPDLEKSLSQAGIHELAILIPFEIDETKMKTVVDKTGILGIGRRTHQEPYTIVRTPISTKEALGGKVDSSEPAVGLYYYATERGNNNNNVTWQRRPGTQFLYAEIIMPQSLGNLVSDEMHRNPKFVRTLVDAFIRNRHSRTLIASCWDKDGKPPYEAWDARPAEARKFYFADLVANPQDKQLPLQQAIERAVSY